MSHTLSDQEKSLLSSFHDGEATPREAAQARQLLERSPEAESWLQDARAVRNMSVESAMRTPLPPLSGKLTGSAIVKAAGAGGAGGGSFFAVARSPFGLAGAAALLLAGAVWTYGELKNPAPFESGRQTAIAAATPETNHSQVLATAEISPQPDANPVTIPPITARDLAGFALDGALPINTERTRFVGMGSNQAETTAAVREIEEGMRELEPLQARALDSLAELLRSSVIRLQGNGLAVRSDLPDLRLAVIERLRDADLSGTARKELNTARRKAQENRAQVLTSLEVGMKRMETGLLAAGETPYVLIESNETIESPAGDRTGRTVVEMIGTRNRVITLNPQAIRITDPNPSLQVSLATATPRRNRPAATAEAGASGRAAAVSAGTSTGTGTAETSASGSDWQSVAAEPFMQSITINLFSSTGMSVVISDEADTTWQWETLYIRSDIYPLSARINALTERLNQQMNRIANDRTKPPEVRAWEMVRKQNIYTRQLRQLLDSANGSVQQDVPNPIPSDSAKKKADDILKDAAEHDALPDREPLESTCMPWEDCTGVG